MTSNFDALFKKSNVEMGSMIKSKKTEAFGKWLEEGKTAVGAEEQGVKKVPSGEAGESVGENFARKILGSGGQTEEDEKIKRVAK